MLDTIHILISVSTLPTISHAACTDQSSPRECYEAGLADVGNALAQLKTLQNDLKSLRNDFDSFKSSTTSQINTLSAEFSALDLQEAFGPTELINTFHQLGNGLWEVAGHCPQGTLVVGFFCEVESGSGRLQNAEIRTDDNAFS